MDSRFAFVSSVPALASSFAGQKVVAKKCSQQKTSESTSIRMSAEKKTNRVAVAGAAALAAVAAALTNPQFALADGAAIFSNNCAACHAGGNNVIAAEKTLKKDALEQYLEGGYSVDAIKYQVTNGKNAMPAFGGRLADDEIAEVAEYVFAQAGKGW